MAFQDRAVELGEPFACSKRSMLKDGRESRAQIAFEVVIGSRPTLYALALQGGTWCYTPFVSIGITREDV